MAHSKQLSINLNPEHPNTLAGLDALLKLDLIGNEFVLALGQYHLSCELPEIAPVQDLAEAPGRPTPLVPASAATISEDFVLAKPAEKLEVLKQKVPSIWGRFFEELSVRWLLFLGVFLVVLSSGILVANQWANFPAIGQYLVLWGYTMTFGGIGIWAKCQDGLALTAKTLGISAILLIPLNFWAIDQFGVWGTPIQAAVAIAAAICLLLMGRQLSRQLHWLQGMTLGYTALSLGHWVWQGFWEPTISIYLALGILIVILWGLPLLKKRRYPLRLPEQQGFGFLYFGLGVMFFRAIAVSGVPLGKLGFSLGLLGWLFTELKPQKFSAHGKGIGKTGAIAHFWEILGGALMLLGWLGTVGQFHWQVLGITAIALLWLVKKLRQSWRPMTAIALFVVGLQGWLLISNVLPDSLTEWVASLGSGMAFYDYDVLPVYGLASLPYLMVWAIATRWFFLHQKKNLAITAEVMVILATYFCAPIVIFDSTWRIFHALGLAALALYFAEFTRLRQRIVYFYASHGLGLLAFCACIDRYAPTLLGGYWGYIFLMAMAVEWAICTRYFPQLRANVWQRSCWHYGLGLASLSLIFFFVDHGQSLGLYRLAWIAAPGMLTFSAHFGLSSQRRFAAPLSAGALILFALLNAVGLQLPAGSASLFVPEFGFPPSLRFFQVFFGLAVGLMALNVHSRPHQTMVNLHVGFGIAWLGCLLGGRLYQWNWLVAIAIAGGLCWLASSTLSSQERPTARLYAASGQRWGFFLSWVVAVAIGFYCLVQWVDFNGAYPISQFGIASGILVISLGYRYRRAPENAAFMMGMIALEGLLVAAVLGLEGPKWAIAVAHLGLALVCRGLSHFKSMAHSANLSWWRAYPLIFIVLSWVWRLGYWAPYSGALSIGSGLLLLTIANRDYPARRFLRFLGFASISAGFYETVLYQMFQSSGDNLSNALVVLALTGVIIAYGYRSLYWVDSAPWHKQNDEHLPPPEITLAANFHWCLAALCNYFVLPDFMATPPSFKILAIAVNVALFIYALLEANRRLSKPTPPWPSIWIYLGVLGIFATGIQAWWLWPQLAIFSPYRLLLISLASLFVLTSPLPWTQLSWERRPWCHVAIASPLVYLLFADAGTIAYPSLIAAILVYLCYSQLRQNWRWSYPGFIFGHSLVNKLLLDLDLVQPLSISLQVGLTMLLIAQIDPDLRQQKFRRTRFYGQLLGSGLICLTALIYYQQFGLTPALIGLGFALAGLTLHIRAFLYNGTITLLLTGIYQLMVLVGEYPFSKWIIGLAAGVALISVAANLEKRRESMAKLLKNWMEALQGWQ